MKNGTDMAQNKFSLSWFKKRTAYLNKTFGTSYSPKALHSIYQHTGQMPQAFSELPDPRGKIDVAPLYEDAFTESLRSRFAQLGRANNYVQSVLDGIGGWISPNGSRVYIGSANGIMSKVTNRPAASPAAWTAVNEIPKGARPLTPRLAYDLIKAKAKAIQEKEKTHPHAGYKGA